MHELIKKLFNGQVLKKEELKAILEGYTPDIAKQLAQEASRIRKKWYGDAIYVRGLIEFTNYCKNDCYYCGIRKSNCHATRYRLRKEDILDCCDKGYEIGFRTFVLQGGEDSYWKDERLCEVISAIKYKYPQCAITLSVGERSKQSYQRLFDAGADRYLLRHETANEKHYSLLHPKNLDLEHRKQCLYALKEIGYQVGCGFMVGSPYQSVDTIAEDLCFLQEFQPHMVGIGPFIPHKDTPFAKEKAGTLEMTLYLLSIVRLLLPKVLLPATTALGSIHEKGREKGILAGANVMMPNLSPENIRKNYLLYDNKISTGEEAAENLKLLKAKMTSIGCMVAINRGDSLLVK